MHLQESGEMYLESIFRLSQTSSSVRAIDLSEYMGFSKPSVSRALGLLRTGGYVTTDEEGYLHLTDAGLEVATKIFERHKILTKFLVSLGVEESVASEDACKMEHDISDHSFEAIKRYVSEQ